MSSSVQLAPLLSEISSNKIISQFESFQAYVLSFQVYLIISFGAQHLKHYIYFVLLESYIISIADSKILNLN